ncbi:unnamed protein product [Diamesa serratosioi]
MIQPQPYYSSSIPNKVNARNQLHKLLLQHKSEENILKEITNGACVYQRTKANQSALFLAICHRYENVTSTLLKIYEEDYKVMLENGFSKDSTVLFAFGKEDFNFVESEISKLSEKSSVESGCKIIILCKEKNELIPCVKLLNAKTEEDQLVALRIIEKIYHNGSFDVNIKSLFGDTLFHVAAHQGYINVMEKLETLGAVFDQQNDKKITPFYYACINNNLEVVKFIHKTFKVDLLKTLLESDLVFSIASAGNIEIFEYFLKQIKKYEGEEQLKDIFQLKTHYHEYNVLQKAIVNEKQEFVIRCLEYNPDLIVKNNCGDNILHLAFKSQNGKELSRLLIKKSPELLLKENMNQWTPLHILATRGWTKEFIGIYQKYPNFKNSFFCVTEDEKLTDHSAKLTPGHFVMTDVVGNSHFELAAFIIENHPEHFESSEFISELLNQAVGLENSIEFIKKLQKLKSFNVNVPDRNGNYALMLALKARQLENYNHLISTCAINENFNVIIDRKEKRNLLFYAIWEESIKIDLKIEQKKTLVLDLDSDSDEEKLVEEKKAPLAASEIEDVPKDDFKEERLSYYKIFEKLLSEKVNVQLKDISQETLLHIAVKKNNSEVLKRVIECGLNLEDVDKNGNTLLHLVNSVNIFQFLMTKVKPEMLNQKNNHGQTPLVSFLNRFEVETKEATELLKAILSFNPDINASDKNKNTPLHVVSAESWAKALIEQGADINATNFIGENVVHLALKMQRWTLARFFLTTTSIDRFAVNNDNVSYLGYIALANVDYHEIFGGGLEIMFELLIQKFTNGKAMNGGSLPISALFYDSDLPLRLINCQDADVHSKSPENLTCLHCAIILNSKLSFDIVKILLSKGVAINEPNEQGKTPLMLSIEYKKPDISNYLLSQESIELDVQDLMGDTALHYAAHHQNVEVICKLLQHRAKYQLLNNENKSFHHKLNQFNQQLFCFYANIMQHK